MTRHIFLNFATAGLSALVLSGCISPVPDAVENPLTPTQQFEAKVSSVPEEVRLAIHAGGLSSAQADALKGLVAGWRSEEGGMIGIQAPHVGVDGAAAYRMSEGARAFLIGQGVPADQIELVGYDPKGDPRPPLLVGYLSYRTEIPECGKSWPSITRTIANKPTPNFGCSITANIAAQVANPADLLGPRASDPADAGRRMDVLTKYRKGEITATKKDDNATGAVSKAIN
ncbi:CpaD family pilus assembly protein [Phenylobacterium sp.]|uniref:CpaD family pilus assembly protein n=1 Tax=Phenylobacterium sp. TaxID=1871053 RepID=UPI00273690B4|nr:CpaD family pilus assembly protein [Phenylobacterium sp.]MDP3660711.1 CpaD family pilus assembly protein [Phenylobacterium sp.]